MALVSWSVNYNRSLYVTGFEQGLASIVNLLIGLIMLNRLASEMFALFSVALSLCFLSQYVFQTVIFEPIASNIKKRNKVDGDRASLIIFFVMCSFLLSSLLYVICLLLVVDVGVDNLLLIITLVGVYSVRRYAVLYSMERLLVLLGGSQLLLMSVYLFYDLNVDAYFYITVSMVVPYLFLVLHEVYVWIFKREFADFLFFTEFDVSTAFILLSSLIGWFQTNFPVFYFSSYSYHNSAEYYRLVLMFSAPVLQFYTQICLIKLRSKVNYSPPVFFMIVVGVFASALSILLYFLSSSIFPEDIQFDLYIVGATLLYPIGMALFTIVSYSFRVELKYERIFISNIIGSLIVFFAVFLFDFCFKVEDCSYHFVLFVAVSSSISYVFSSLYLTSQKLKGLL